jgi:hypothetical protein
MPTLASFAFLRQVDAKMTTHDFAKRAASAFFLWPKELLDEELNRRVLAHVVQHDLFAGHQSGWDDYVGDLRAGVPWFGEDLGPVPEPDLNSARTAWPAPAEANPLSTSTKTEEASGGARDKGLP